MSAILALLRLTLLCFCIALGRSSLAPLTWVDQTEGALLLDGTRPAVYISHGVEAEKWIVWHQGGGWCFSDYHCLGRSRGPLGSSAAYPAQIELRNISFPQLCDDPARNPFLHGWSKVFIPYGDSMSGIADLASPVRVNQSSIFYRGAKVVRATIAQLTQGVMRHAREVIIGGTSAGGLTALLHVDRWAAALPRARVVALADSAFFPGVATGGFDAEMRWMVDRANGTSSLPPACVAAQVRVSERQSLGLQFSGTLIFALHAAAKQNLAMCVPRSVPALPPLACVHPRVAL